MTKDLLMIDVEVLIEIIDEYLGSKINNYAVTEDQLEKITKKVNTIKRDVMRVENVEELNKCRKKFLDVKAEIDNA